MSSFTSQPVRRLLLPNGSVQCLPLHVREHVAKLERQSSFRELRDDRADVRAGLVTC